MRQYGQNIAPRIAQKAVAHRLGLCGRKAQRVWGAGHCRHWHLYCLFARCPDALELAKEHPVVAYALARCWVFQKPEPSRPMRAARSLVRKPVPAIWEWLGLPVNPMALGMYGWLEPRGLTIKRLLDYRAAMRRQSSQQFLFDLGPLEWECLELAITPWMSRLITSDLIRDVSAVQRLGFELGRTVERGADIPSHDREGL